MRRRALAGAVGSAVALAASAGAAAPQPVNGDILVVRGSQLVLVTPAGADVRDLTPPGWRVHTAGFSRLGGKVAFTATPPGETDPELFTMAANGTSIRRLTNNGLSETDPSWSPDGRRIAFSSARTGLFQIWTMPSAGGRLGRVSRQTEDCYDPAWSPTGAWIVYSCQVGYFKLILARPDGRGERRLMRRYRVTEADPAWSPDGRWIVFARDQAGASGNGLYTVRPNGSGLRRILPFGADPYVSPDGRLIAFIRLEQPDNELWVAARSGLAARRLTNNEVSEAGPSWRPR